MVTWRDIWAIGLDKIKCTECEKLMMKKDTKVASNINSWPHNYFQQEEGKVKKEENYFLKQKSNDTDLKIRSSG